MAVNYPYEEMYRDMLAEVQKHHAGTIVPEEAARLVNQSIDDLVNSKLDVMEINKEVFDALLPLKRIVNKLAMTIDATSSFTPAFNYTIPVEVKRIMKVAVFLGDSDVPVKCALLKSNQSTDLLSGVFSKPSIHGCYYTKDIDPRIIKVYTPVGTTTAFAYIEYYVEADRISSTDIISPTIVSDFDRDFCIQVTKIAASKYLERVMDPRYKSFQNERNNA